MSQALPRASGPFVPFTSRVFSALMLRREAYERVAAEPSTMSEAVVIVAFSSMMRPSLLTQEFGAWGMLMSILFGLGGWLFFTTVVAYPIARLITRAPIEYQRLLRCLGYAEAPGILYLFHYMSSEGLPQWFRVGVWLWLLAATIVGVRAATGVTLVRAAGIGVLSFLAYLVIGLVTAVIGYLPPS